MPGTAYLDCCGTESAAAKKRGGSFMNLLARRENEFPVELEHTFPGVEEFFRSIFGSPDPELLRRHHPWGPVHDLKVGEKRGDAPFRLPRTQGGRL